MTPERKAALDEFRAACDHAALVLQQSEERQIKIRALADEAERLWASSRRRLRAAGWVPPEERSNRVA